MNVLVLLAGVADPKWPLSAVAEPPSAARVRNHMGFSPFDEAALEVALKIRDGDRQTRLTVAVTGGAESETLLRKAAAFRPDRIVRVAADSLAVWDARQLAIQLRHVVTELAPDAELILTGREFGDFDSGALPPVLACVLGCPFFGLAQHAQWEAERLVLVREQGRFEERLAVTGRMVASVTNDRRNRLRHPLMKNVMEARRATIGLSEPPEADNSTVVLRDIVAARPPQREVECRVLTGPLSSQIAELARFLEPWRAQSGR
jgi:electron transfer flavoprotein beta subunit